MQLKRKGKQNTNYTRNKKNEKKKKGIQRKNK